MNKKYVNLLKPEQQGCINDALIQLARLRHENPDKFKEGWSKVIRDLPRGLDISINARWIEDKKDPTKDEFIIRIGGLITLDPVPQPQRERTVPGDPNTVLVDEVTVDLTKDS